MFTRFSPWVKPLTKPHWEMWVTKAGWRKTPDPNQADSQAQEHNPFLEKPYLYKRWEFRDTKLPQKTEQAEGGQAKPGHGQQWMHLSLHGDFAPFWFSFCCSGLISAMKSNLSSSLCLAPIMGTGEGAAFPKAAVMRTTDQRARPVPSLEFLIFASTPRAAALFFKGTLW